MTITRITSVRETQSIPSARGRKRVGGGDGGGNEMSLGEGVRREGEVEDRVILLGNRSSIQSSENLSNRSSIIVTDTSSRERAGGEDGGGNGMSLGEGVGREGEVEDTVILLGNNSSIQSSENLRNSSLIIVTPTSSLERVSGGDGGGNGSLVEEVVRTEGGVGDRDTP